MPSMSEDQELHEDCVFKGPQRRVSWHQGSLICSPDYYTLASSTDTYEPLLLHRVPSPSLCLDEMLQLWPAHNEDEKAPHYADYLSPHQDGCRDSVATLVDFGGWVSRQSHNRSSSLLPPAPQLHCHELTTVSDSVECRLSSAWSSPSKQIEATHHMLPYMSKRSTTPDQLTRLCAEFESSSFSSARVSPIPTRATTPVPSLTHSRHSMSSCSATGTYSPTPTVKCSLPNPRERSTAVYCHSSETAMRTIDRSDSGNRADQTVSSMPAHANSAMIPSPSIYQEEFGETSSRSSHTDKFQWTTDQQNDTRNRHASDLAPSLTQAPIPRERTNNPEISYIDWDDDEDNENVGSGPSRLARMKKSFTDLRNAERLISEAASKVNAIKKTNHQQAATLRNTKVNRPVLDLRPLDSSATIASPHRFLNQHQNLRQSTTHQISTDNILTLDKFRLTGAEKHHSSLPSRSGSRALMANAKLRRKASSKSLSTVHSEVPSPWGKCGQDEDDQFPTSIRQSMRHKRRTISSQLEGFSPMNATPCIPTFEAVLDQDHCSLKATPALPRVVPSKRKRFSSMTFNMRSENIEKGKEKGNKKPKLTVVGKWVRKIFRGVGQKRKE